MGIEYSETIKEAIANTARVFKPKLHRCPSCHQDTMQVIYDDEINSGYDSFICSSCGRL